MVRRAGEEGKKRADKIGKEGKRGRSSGLAMAGEKRGGSEPGNGVSPRVTSHLDRPCIVRELLPKIGILA